MLVVEAVTLSGLPWLAGRGYEMLVASVPVVHTAVTSSTAAASSP